jgi:hypothetical protein
MILKRGHPRYIEVERGTWTNGARASYSSFLEKKLAFKSSKKFKIKILM